MEKVNNNHCKCDLKKEGKKYSFLVGQHCEKLKPWTFKGIFKTSVTVLCDLNLLASLLHSHQLVLSCNQLSSLTQKKKQAWCEMRQNNGYEGDDSMTHILQNIKKKGQ